MYLASLGSIPPDLPTFTRDVQMNVEIPKIRVKFKFLNSVSSTMSFNESFSSDDMDNSELSQYNTDVDDDISAAFDGLDNTISNFRPDFPFFLKMINPPLYLIVQMMPFLSFLIIMSLMLETINSPMDMRLEIPR